MSRRPPGLTRRLLEWVLPSSIRGEAVLGDLEEEFRDRAEREGGLRAAWWYRRQAWRVIGVYTLPGERPSDPVEVLTPSRAARSGGGFEALRQDLGHGVRILRRSPGSSLLVILALALGIGANTAIFSAIDAVLLRPLPFTNPDRVVQIIDQYASQSDRSEVLLSFPNFRDYERANSFRHVAAIRANTVYLDAGDENPAVHAFHISHDLFEMMGVRPEIGRTFLPEEDAFDPDPVALLSYREWQDRMGGDPDVLGRSLTLTRWIQGEGWQPITAEIVGVMPEGFELPALQIGEEYRVWGDPEIFLPLGMWHWGRGNRGMWALRAVAELAPGVSLAQARQEMESMARGIRESDPDAEGLSVRVVPIREIRDARYGPALWVLWGASALILLVVCANVAALLLGRALARDRELAVRTTLGASRSRIFRQLLSESVLLGGAGALAGLLFAYWGAALLKQFTPGSIYGLAEAGLDLRVLLFSAAASLATVLLFGLGPALRGMRTQPADALRAGRRAGHGSTLRPMRWLVVGQVAVSMALLTGSGLLIRSLGELLSVDPGFEPERTIHVTTQLPPPPLSKYGNPEAVHGLFAELRERLEAMPGVVRVAGANTPGPLRGSSFGSDVTMADRPVDAQAARPLVNADGVSLGYFEALGTPVLQGRTFTPQDREESIWEFRQANPWAGVPVVVNRAMAEYFWPGENPIGKRFYWGRQDPAVVEATLGRVEWSEEWDQRYPVPYPHEVIGVVGDVKAATLRDEAPMGFYQLHNFVLSNLYIRVGGDAESLVAPIRQVVESMDPELTVSSVRPMTAAVRADAASTRFQAGLLSLFAGLAVFMTGLGLFGVLAYAVSRRSHEMAVRMSLGARRSEVSRMVVGDGLKLGVPGLVLGAGVALLATHSLSSLLFGVSPTDPVTLAASALLVLSVTLLACWMPALRATRVDPMTVLRED